MMRIRVESTSKLETASSGLASTPSRAVDGGETRCGLRPQRRTTALATEPIPRSTWGICVVATASLSLAGDNPSTSCASTVATPTVDVLGHLADQTHIANQKDDQRICGKGFRGAFVQWILLPLFCLHACLLKLSATFINHTAEGGKMTKKGRTCHSTKTH